MARSSTITSLASGAWSIAITRIDQAAGYNVERLVVRNRIAPGRE